MKKLLNIIKILVNKKFLFALFTIIAVAVPASKEWIGLNSESLVNSISAIATTLAVLFAYLEQSPKQVDEKNKGGKR